MNLRNMDNLHFYSSVPGFRTSAESDSMSEYTTTISSLEIEVTDQSLEMEQTNALLIIIYGIGGVLVFLVVFVICYGYWLLILEADDLQEAILRMRNQYSTPYRRAPYHDRRIFHEDFAEQASSPNTIPKQVGNFHGMDRKRENYSEAKREPESYMSETSFSCYNPLQSEGSISPTDGMEEYFYQNYRPLRVAKCGHVVPRKSESLAKLEAEWPMEPPLSFSSPRESFERILFSGKDKNATSSSFSEEMCDRCNIINDEKYSKEVGVEPSVNVAKQSVPSPERQTRSSPTSPDLVRRRIPTHEGDTPRRPSSWL